MRSMQGVTIIAGVDNAWGGFAARYVENLRDELGKGTIWVWGVDETLKAAEDTRVSAFKLWSMKIYQRLVRNEDCYG